MTETNSVVIQADRLALPAETTAGWVEIQDDRIVAIGEGNPTSQAPVEKVSGWLTPGFVDQHCHGGGGTGYETTDPAAIANARQLHLQHGTTSAIGSLVSASRSDIRTQTEFLADQCRAGLLDGLHLEGPWISPHHKGAHRPQNLREPSVAEFEDLLKLGDGYLRMVTIAPELPEALDVIRACRANGVVAAVGHTGATYDQTVAAIDAGATVATHLFNTMPKLRHRHPGAIAALLNDERVFLELIVDGVHLHPGVVNLAANAASERIVLVTDAMAAAGSTDGTYQLANLEVEVSDGIARLTSSQALAGSTLTMDAAFRNFVETGSGTGRDAVAATAGRPANLMGLADRGAIRVGARADLCHLSDTLELQAVWHRGKKVERVGL